MTFNAALTGLRAANKDLEVSGNNIANASTVGFKESRAEFADVYASTAVGGGSNAVGNGVRVANIAQQFSQGSISFTDKPLDLAVNGGGFFVLSDAGTQVFSRAGQFGVDDQGFIVANGGARLQGFDANDSGVVGGVLNELQISTNNIDPRQTSLVDVGFNLDADSLVLAVRGNSTTSDGTDIGVLQVGGTNQPNGYQADTVDINGNTLSIPSVANLSASDIAAELTSVAGVTAAATTVANFTYAPGGGGTVINPGELSINGRSITGTTVTEVAQSINSQVGLTASVAAGIISVTATDGADLVFSVAGGGSGLSLDVDSGTTITEGTAAEFLTKGGEISVNLDEGVTFTGGTGAVNSIFSPLPALFPFEENTFDPSDQNTYNASTSATIYDSLGSAHVLSMFFVKETISANPPNTWTLYVQVDGQEVGDPDSLAVDPLAPTRASYTVRFNADGSLDTVNSDPILVSNWQPLDASGVLNGSLGPAPVASGGALPIPVPATSSNFQIDIDQATQYSGVFSVNSLDQTGFATGQLSGLDISESGAIFARYSNGEALILGQVALADFANQQGLTPIGDTSWVESFESGQPVIGSPLSASLGAIQSGALEESNVELAEELVSLIISQRNFQANARTIETANEITQTIINLR
ncbi:MAG: flagellar hook protein FlgE [Gammaproteobacteria bacterium]|nr:flagellar hook protein FlgE [Gammaproteobacteria bacterium]NNL10966.1 flagellar hook-basal body complex protein [Pseudomonadales bacterium]NNM12138.1 flagellar hook-basal body complex protein [Pseudomonadales bacterium]